ncbi:MAG: membrane protein insertion efficiency factor YidD [Candidatus Lokiarchaeota archaeon]|nr:membrane protein insertion efficiency factor YidD [Candidatus Lokiarchaeota archaeon]
MVKTILKIKSFINCFLLLLIFFSFDSGQAQHINNLNFIFSKIEKPKLNKVTPDSLLKSTITSETKYLGIGLIKFYQHFISTQDKPTCIFSLSCSHFGLEAVKHRGFLIGTLLTADRLTRCNSVALRYYKIDPITLKAIDIIPLYEFRKK